MIITPNDNGFTATVQLRRFKATANGKTIIEAKENTLKTLREGIINAKRQRKTLRLK